MTGESVLNAAGTEAGVSLTRRHWLPCPRHGMPTFSHKVFRSADFWWEFVTVFAD